MSCCGSSKNNKEKNNTTNNMSPLDQLKIRLVNGEIDMEEYLKTKQVIEES